MPSLRRATMPAWWRTPRCLETFCWLVPSRSVSCGDRQLAVAQLVEDPDAGRVADHAEARRDDLGEVGGDRARKRRHVVSYTTTQLYLCRLVLLRGAERVRERRSSSRLTSSSGRTSRSARHSTTAPSIAAIDVVARRRARAAGTPRPRSSRLQRSRQLANASAAAAAAACCSSSASTATATTGQPARKSEPSSVARQNAVNSRRTTTGSPAGALDRGADVVAGVAHGLLDELRPCHRGSGGRSTRAARRCARSRRRSWSPLMPFSRSSKAALTTMRWRLCAGLSDRSDATMTCIIVAVATDYDEHHNLSSQREDWA